MGDWVEGIDGRRLGVGRGGDRLGMNSKAGVGKEAVTKDASLLLGQLIDGEDGVFLPINEAWVDILVDNIVVCGGKNSQLLLGQLFGEG